MDSLFRTELIIPQIKPEIIFYLGNIPITNSFLAALIVSAILIFFAIIVRVYTKGIGSSSNFQIVAELITEKSLDFIESISQDRELANKILGIVGTLFVYITISNLLLTFFPILGDIKVSAVTGEEASLFRSPSNDVNYTVALASSMVILAQIFSIRQNNLWNHINKYIQLKPVFNGFRQGIGAGFTSLIGFFVGILDLMSEFAKIISLSLRLFGNVFAGEVLIVVIMSLFSFILPVPLILLGLLTGVLQAIVFGALVTSYITLSVSE